MAKRRSSTRVGRKHPRPTAAKPDALPVRHYIISRPVLMEGTVYRVVRSSATHVEVQEWQGMYWQPSACPLWSVEEGPPAPGALLEALGVPEESWLVDGQQRWTTPELRVLTVVEGSELTRQEVVA